MGAAAPANAHAKWLHCSINSFYIVECAEKGMTSQATGRFSGTEGIAMTATGAAELVQRRRRPHSTPGQMLRLDTEICNYAAWQRCPRRLTLLALILAAARFLSEAPGAAAVSTSGRRLLQGQPPEWPRQPAPPPPPPPAYFGTAGSSLEFFRLLYGSNVTEIRISNDITLDTDDALAAYNASGRGAGAGAATALGVGVNAPVLDHNLTIVGASRGTHTRLDFNFLSAILRLTSGVTLTLRGLEVYRALNRIGQDLDFVAKSWGGTVRLENCVQRRAACVPFYLAVAQILSLPAANGSKVAPDVSLRNDSAFCWSTSTLLPTCKQPSTYVRALSVYIAPLDGVLAENGGYDVSCTNSHIVCDYPIDPECLRTSTADTCMARELSRRFGNAAPPPLLDGTAGRTSPDAAGGKGAGGGGGTSPTVVGLVAGLAGGGTVLILLVVGAIFFVRRQDRRAANTLTGAKHGEADGDGGGSAAAAAAAATAAGGTGARASSPAGTGGGGGSEDESTVGVAIGGAAADASPACKDSIQRSASSRKGGGGGASSSSREASSEARCGGGGGGGGTSDSSRAARVARAAAADAAGRTYSSSDPWDVEAIRRTLLGVRQTDAPLNVQLLQLLGEGSFGKVYKGIWHGTLVALKVLVLSGNLTQDQRRRQMAVMEAAISSAMSHPNIVQTYTYSFRALKDGGRVASHAAAPSGDSTPPSSGVAEAPSGDGGGEIGPAEGLDASSEVSCVYGHELLLVLEYCDRGSLRQALNAGLFHRHAGGAAATEPGAYDGAGAGAPDDAGDQGASGLTPAAEFSTLTGLPPPPKQRTLSYTGASTATGAAAAAAAARASEEGAAARERRRSGEGRSAYNFALMLQAACDVASALLHLHSHGVVHGDVKASNVLLKTAASDDRRHLFPNPAPRDGAGGGGDRGRVAGSSGWASPAATAATSPPSASTSATTASASGPYSPASGVGLVAKVADFGLSTIIGYEGDTERTHISALTAQGSLNHMAPELLLHGHISKRVDVYAFGVLLFELFTAERAHRGVPRALLPHQVAICGLRPVLPPYTPADYRALAESCWQAEPAKRPTFDVILAELNRMRAAHVVATAAAAAACRGASFSTSPSLAPSPALGGTCADGWVLVPSLEASNCSSSVFAELVETSTAVDAEAVAAQGPAVVGGVAAAAAAPAGPVDAAVVGDVGGSVGGGSERSSGGGGGGSGCWQNTAAADAKASDSAAVGGPTAAARVSGAASEPPCADADCGGGVARRSRENDGPAAAQR